MVEIVTTMILSSLLLGETYGTVTLVGAILVLLSLMAVAEI
jgi:drug/metabolite transporter (DMT)-like permease